MDHQSTMKLNWLTLKFSGYSANLEIPFRKEYYIASLPINRAAMFIGAFFYALFGILDALLMPEQKSTIWLIRYGVVTPAMVAVLVFSYTAFFKRCFNPLMAGVSVLAGGGIIWMVIIAPPPINYSYYAGILLVFIWTYTLIRIPFLWACLAAWVQVVLYEIAAIWISDTPIVFLINNNFFFISSNILGMIACYSLEYSARRNFFLTEQLKIEREKINSINRQLEQQTKKYQVMNENLALEISERKHAENELLKSEERFNQLAEQSGTVIWEVDVDGLYTYVSHVSNNVLKRRPDEMIGHLHFYDLHPQSGREAFKKYALEVFDRKEHFINLENPAETGDGKVVWLSTNGIPLQNSDGTLRGYRGSDVNITERRNAEQALRDTEKRFRLITDNLNDIVWLMDMELQTTWITPSVERIRGYTLDDLRNIPLEGQLTPQSLERAFELIKKHFSPEKLADAHEHISLDEEFEFYCKDGSTIWADTVITLLRDEQGKPRGYLSVSRDTSERRKMEDQLRESKELFTRVVDSLPDMIVRTDLEGTILYINDHALQISGFAREEIEGHNMLDFIAPEDQAQVIQNVFMMMENKLGPKEYRIFMKDGRKVPFDVNGDVLRYENGTPFGLVNVCRDITERKKAEQALKVSEHSFRMLASYHEQLNAISITFTETGSMKELHEKIAVSLRLLTNALATSLAVYSPSTRELTVSSLSLDSQASDVASVFFGPEVFEMRMPVSSDNLDQMLRERIQRPKDLHELSFGAIPTELSDVVMAAAGLRQIIALPVIYAEEILGTCVIYLGEGQEVVPDDALRTFTYMTGMAIVRRRSQEALQRAHAELEQRVTERTYELTAANQNLQDLFSKQEINIDLAKNILSMINYRPNRHTLLPGNIELFFTACYLPCHTEGGDHYFIKNFTGGHPDLSKTAISLKDQSGHEVGCILRSIITDLIHNALLVQNPDLPIGETISRLNFEICGLPFFGDENFFTSLDAEIHHESLRMRYVSAGHPPFLLIRGREVACLPALDGRGRNLPVGIERSLDYQNGTVELLEGDQLIFFTDGLTDMPHMSGKPVLNADDLRDMLEAMLPNEPRLPVSVLMARLFNRINGREGDKVMAPQSLYDDITLLGLELESGDYEYEDIVRPKNLDDLDDCVKQLYTKISREWQVRGFVSPKTRLRMVLDEAMVNAWSHGNHEDPRKMIIVRRRYGNDAVLEVIDEGEGFDYKTFYDPTSRNNLLNPRGRGNFIMRLLTEETQWKDGGRRLIAYFSRDYSQERAMKSFSGFNLWRRFMKH